MAACVIHRDRPAWHLHRQGLHVERNAVQRTRLQAENLLTRVMNNSAAVVDRNIDVHIGSIRRKLGPYRKLIQTVRGVGYRFRG